MTKVEAKHIVVKGHERTIEFGRRSDDSMPAKTFYDSLDEQDRDRLFTLFVDIASHGEPKGKCPRFRPETKLPKDIKRGKGRLWAFKDTTHRKPGGGKGMLRISCFRIGNRWILLYGFWKPPQAKWPPNAISESFAILREVLQREEQQDKGK